MMTCCCFANRTFSCRANAAAASFAARTHNLVDTAIALVVSICVLLLDVRVILPKA